VRRIHMRRLRHKELKIRTLTNRLAAPHATTFARTVCTILTLLKIC